MKRTILLAIFAILLLICGTSNAQTNANSVFYVSPTKKVLASGGNLQYNAALGTYRFAKKQYDIVGYSNDEISESYNSWIDLFGWGTGKNPTQNITNNSSYQEFNDWGNYIGIEKWRTLTSEEWEYLFNNHLYAYGMIHLNPFFVAMGLIIFPQSYTPPKPTNISTEGIAMYYISIPIWKKMEKAGAIFLPLCGERYDNDIHNAYKMGVYWSSTAANESTANRFVIPLTKTTPSPVCDRFIGNAVRLFKDVE